MHALLRSFAYFTQFTSFHNAYKLCTSDIDVHSLRKFDLYLIHFMQNYAHFNE